MTEIMKISVNMCTANKTSLLKLSACLYIHIYIILPLVRFQFHRMTWATKLQDSRLFARRALVVRDH